MEHADQALGLVALALLSSPPLVAGQGAPGRGGSLGQGGPDAWGVLLTISGMIGVMWLVERHLLAPERAKYAPPGAGDFVCGAPAGAAFPSGIWRGYYSQCGKRHALSDLAFEFHAHQETIGGAGVDAVGRYTIQGVFAGSRLAFSKCYQPGSAAADGRVNAYMNRGHTVEYRGGQVGPSLALGVRGDWFIAQSDSGYMGRGSFHLWPAMPDWHGQQPTPDGQPAAPPRPPVIFEVTADNVCVVCFARPINTCLRPCGHVAACSRCVRRLQPPDCPICRTHIAKAMSCRECQIEVEAGLKLAEAAQAAQQATARHGHAEAD